MRRSKIFVVSAGAIALLLSVGYYAEFSGPKRVEREYSAVGIARVVLRSINADSTLIEYGGKSVLVSGMPAGGAGGYHAPNPLWRPTKAKNWGLDFVSQKYGDTLVISSWNEIQYVHHSYHLDQLKIQVPDGVSVVCRARQGSGDGSPDLSRPKETDKSQF